MLTRGITIFVWLMLTAARLSAEVDERAVLWAIAQVETGDRNDAIGALGERSAYQFMRYVWRQYTRTPFERASSEPALARRVAQLHYRAIVVRLQRMSQPVTVRAIAQAWNPGAPADYAQRIVNLAEAAR